MTARTIWTIGYEQATVPAVMGALRKAGVEVLADVRALPLSRRPGFSKSALAANAREAGIDYVHFKALGTPAEGRAAARRNDHETLERIYEGQLELPEAIVAGAQLAELAANRRVALLCYEREAHGCHRTLLRKAVLPGFKVVDLLPEDT
ncbi:conserved hypothetical protein [Novosphingobium aromaticivorans DSM 12444]|uniref:DUF488 domain-containing protein n=1 Tax=Novosphingobium aromaticivorans (strain ATCC 700278 / DSM 12444 / CCUG 56034 / CIP 105152 / NBRC 16084 / F199) TaxID=279238 RepID=Q2G735_NOVAD|nr:DUF488 domain-containing protein [Novosphingobium aromaticivorans]ABD26338.1 conserved hypothetical protein [Novosphingobium aromaticivorans DSM 12444]SCY54191.1 Protein of unknown function, DUF488 [Novosphingobium aromaticivorans]